MTDLPPYVTSREDYVHNFFSQFGRIADFYLADNGSYCLVNFCDSEPLEHVLGYPVSMYGRRLKIRRRRQNNKPGPNSENEMPSYHQDLLDILSKKKSFKEQVEEFFNVLEADETDFRKRFQVCRDLEYALKGLSSTYKIQPFGSSVNGLAFKDSDLDLFYGKEPNCTGPDVRNLFDRVSKILKNHPHFTSVNPIPNARVPIIKLVHKETRCSCDLSFRNTMGVQNSQLIKFLTTLDERVKPLFMILKYWAKLHHLTGKRMSNYALIMLLTNFLQSLNQPILPPLNMLKHDGVAKIKVAEWAVNFDYTGTRLRPITNVLPVEELLVRFFHSVVRTDFAKYVICPLEGALIHKGYFHDLDLSAEMKDYVYNVKKGIQPLKIDSVLCIQDPIELNLNLTKNVSKHDFQCFIDHCNIAIDISNTEPPHLFLSQLLSNVYPRPNKGGRKSWHLNPMHVPAIQVRPFMTLSVPFPENMEDKILWRNELLQKLKLILKKVLKIDVEHQTMDKEAKPGADQNLKCIGSQVLWRERDVLWNQWYQNKSDILVCDKDNEDEIQVVYMKDEDNKNAQGSFTGKRKSNEGMPDAKRRKTETQDDLKHESKEPESDVIIIESEKTDQQASASSFHDESTLVKRCLQDEINLSNDMVRRKHALPASSPILHFSCNVCLDVNSARIELSDMKSLNNYFNSLCSFLQNFIMQHIIQVESK